MTTLMEYVIAFITNWKCGIMFLKFSLKDHFPHKVSDLEIFEF